MNLVEISADQLDISSIYSQVVDPSCGAVSLFIGTTRDTFEGRSVVHLEYEAYDAMARTQMHSICTDIRSRWCTIHHIALVHRVGVVPLTEASVVIAISSPHRKEAMDAVQFAIDQIKAIVPIWKKEFYTDGDNSWKENKECSWSKS